jgi:hypothetical protein
MNMKKWILAGVAAIGLAGLIGLPSTQPAQAATALMCQGDVSGATTGTRTIGGTGSAVPSGTLYTLNGQGCALVAQADIGYFQSQGFTQAASQNSILYTSGVQTGTTDLVIGNLPANAYVQQIIIVNATANAVTGGVSIGSTANGTDIVAAAACAANCVANATIVKAAFSTTAATALHAAAVTAWNSANVTITVVYGFF